MSPSLTENFSSNHLPSITLTHYYIFLPTILFAPILTLSPTFNNIPKSSFFRDNLRISNPSHRAIPIHGVPTSITELYALTAYDYPDYKVTDFLPGGPWC